MTEALMAIQNYLQGYGVAGLVVLAFIESIIFPVPPDPLLISLALMNTDKAPMYALFTTAASVVGGIFGYALGVQAGRPILLRLFKRHHISRVTKMFTKYGGWAVFVAAFTPIPYKVFTISAGIVKINFVTFLIASAIGRGLRFLSIGLVIRIFGDRALEIIRSSFEVVTIGLSAVILVAAVAYQKLSKKKRA